MTNQQLPTQLPPGWESDYDGTSERWFFIHRPTGFSQFFFPKAGDEKTRVAELAQPQPTNASLMIKMEAMTISEATNTGAPNPQPLPLQSYQLSQVAPAVQPTMTPQPPSSGQQTPSQGSPLSRTISGSVQRKAIPRRDSVQSQASIASSQTAPQPTQQYAVANPQVQGSTTHYMQNIPPGQQYQHPQVPPQTVSMQPAPLHTQPSPMAPIYYQNPQPQPQQSQPHIQSFQTSTNVPTQTQVHQSTSQTSQTSQAVQYQQVQPLQVINQPAQHHIQSSPPSTIAIQGQVQQPAQHAQQQQATNPPFQQQQHYSQPAQTTVPQIHPQYSNSQPHQTMNPQVQPQYANAHIQSQPAQPSTAANQRRFSTIPVSHQATNGQIPSLPLQVNQVQGARHSSIGNGNYQSPPLIQQMHPIPGQAGQPMQYVPMHQNSAPQTQQASSMVQASPGVQYIQQNVAPVPPNLPPPAPGMQWVLVQPGTQKPQAAPIQTVQNPNQSSSFAVQTQQFQGGAQFATGRPGLVTRLSSSTVSGSKKALDSSKGFIKKHPGKTMAIVGGLGIVAEACGVSVISDAVAGSKIYANVQTAKAKRRALIAGTLTPTHSPGPPAQPTQVAHHVNNTTPNGTNPGAQSVLPQTIQQTPHVLHQQNTAPHIGQPGVTTQPMYSPTYQHSHQQSHPQMNPTHTQQHHHLPHIPHLQQDFANQQNAQSTDPPAQYLQNQNPQLQYGGQQFATQQNSQSTDTQFIQGQNPQFQYNGQQSPVQYYQPVNSPQFQNQQQDPSQVYIAQDNSGQSNQGGAGGLATDAYNLLTTGQGNLPTQSQSPSPSAGDNSSFLTQQLPTPTSSPFDPSQLQQSSGPSPSVLFVDPSTQIQQFAAPPLTPFDPSSQLLPQQQFLQDQASAQIANQAISGSDQFTNNLLGQSTLNASIQDDNSYITSPSPTQDFTPNLAGQDMLNASILDDNSYIDAPPSPTLVDTSSDCGDFDMSQAFADQDSAIF